ncbi:MAG: GGDEF domain-containing protein [Terracidiphilus sp.]|jgi:diguanylate cyclase (GGDEF)-like protein
MRDSFGSNAEPSAILPDITGLGRRLSLRVPRQAILILVTLAVVLDACVHAAVASANTPRAAAIGYLCFSLALFGCALAFRTRARAAKGALRIRWFLVAAGALASALAFAPSFAEVVLHTGPARLLQTPLFNTSEAFFLLAIVLFSAGVARSIVVVDMMQAALFVVLRFNLVYSPATRDHFVRNHLLVSQLMSLFLFLAAMVACLGAASNAELRLLRILAWFFGLRLISYFASDQVSYVWSHHVHCSLWDVAGTVLLGGFALHLLYSSHPAATEDEETEPLRLPSVIVRSLMPSFLALVNLMLGLFILTISVPLAAAAITLSLVCYVVRTALLHAQTVAEKTLLESRNVQLEGLAIRDPLTGIGNRRSLAGVYGRLRDSASGESLSLLLMDIDSFKQVNDCHGHLHGDKVLVGLAREMERLVLGKAGSHCSRLGGDEFALLLPGVCHEEASALAEELRKRFSARTFAAADGTVTLSIGVASLVHARELPLETLISYADDALYRAKLLGRNRVEVQPLWEPGAAASDAAASMLRVALQETAS